jgi:hypothetical protein
MKARRNIRHYAKIIAEEKKMPIYLVHFILIFYVIRLQFLMSRGFDYQSNRLRFSTNKQFLIKQRQEKYGKSHRGSWRIWHRKNHIAPEHT